MTPQTLFLTLHQTEPDGGAYSYVVSPSELDELLAYARRKEPTDGYAVRFTFDDGYRSNLEHAVALLAKHETKAIFFVTAGSIEAKPGFMSWEDLRQIASLGHEVQSHSFSHPFLTSCTEQELLRELAGSKQMIENRLGKDVTAISCPGGRCNKRVIMAAREAGYRRVFTSNPWKRSFSVNGMQVTGRMNIGAGVTPADLDSFWSEFARPFSKGRIVQNTKQFAQNLLGDRLYHHLWAKITGWDASRGE